MKLYCKYTESVSKIGTWTCSKSRIKRSKTAQYFYYSAFSDLRNTFGINNYVRKLVSQTIAITKKEKEITQNLMSAIKKVQELEIALEDSQRQRKQLERVLKFLRERADGAKLESLQLKKELQTLQDKAALLTAVSAKPSFSPNKVEDKHELEALQLQLKQLKEQIFTTRQQNDKSQLDLKKEQLESEKLRELLQDSQCKNSAQNHTQDHLESALKNIKNESEAKDQELKLAQQHLAKKMKEASYFSEKCEEQKLELGNLQKLLVEAQAKASAAQQTLETFATQEKQKQDLIKESYVNAEALAKRWEEKYFLLHDKWLRAEEQIKGLKALEERHNQMQNILSSLGVIMSTPTSSEDTQKTDIKDHSSSPYKSTLFN